MIRLLLLFRWVLLIIRQTIHIHVDFLLLIRLLVVHRRLLLFVTRLVVVIIIIISPLKSLISTVVRCDVVVHRSSCCAVLTARWLVEILLFLMLLQILTLQQIRVNFDIFILNSQKSLLFLHRQTLQMWLASLKSNCFVFSPNLSESYYNQVRLAKKYVAGSRKKWRKLKMNQNWTFSQFLDSFSVWNWLLLDQIAQWNTISDESLLFPKILDERQRESLSNNENRNEFEMKFMSGDFKTYNL